MDAAALVLEESGGESWCLDPRLRVSRGHSRGRAPGDQELEPDFITAADLVAAPHRSPGGKARGVDVEQNEGAWGQCLRRGNSGARAVSVDTPNTEPLPIHLDEGLKFQFDSRELPAIRRARPRPVARACSGVSLRLRMKHISLHFSYRDCASLCRPSSTV